MLDFMTIATKVKEKEMCIRDRIKSFKTFWKDLYELNKDSWIWMKKHWKGYFILIAALLGGEYLWFYKKDDLKEMGLKRKETEKQ